MRRPLLMSPLLLCAFAVAQQPAQPPVATLTAEAIMARVAANQDRSEGERAHFLYVQHAHIASRKGHTVRCEETTDTRVTPTASGSNRQLLKLDGRLLQKSAYVIYTRLPKPAKPDTPDDQKAVLNRPADTAETLTPKPPPGSAKPADAGDEEVNLNLGDDTMDRDLVENMREHLTANKSKDGIGANLFPLTSKDHPDYHFTLLGREPRNGRDCYHITFTPKDKDDFGWKGDAWIDAAAFQPVVVRTAMARKIPFAIRALLGTNVPGLGFTIIYAPQPGISPPDTTGSQAASVPDDLWFPTSFGTEFKLHVLFFLRRDIIFNAQNRDFQKTHVTSQIVDPPTASK